MTARAHSAASNKPSSLPKNITSPPGVELSASASETVTVIMGRSKSLGIGLNPDNIITEIDAGSVAARHGLKLGDVIVGWQGQQLSGRRLQDVTLTDAHLLGRSRRARAAVRAAPAPRKTVSRQFSSVALGARSRRATRRRGGGRRRRSRRCPRARRRRRRGACPGAAAAEVAGSRAYSRRRRRLTPPRRRCAAAAASAAVAAAAAGSAARSRCSSRPNVSANRRGWKNGLTRRRATTRRRRRRPPAGVGAALRGGGGMGHLGNGGGRAAADDDEEEALSDGSSVARAREEWRETKKKEKKRSGKSASFEDGTAWSSKEEDTSGLHDDHLRRSSSTLDAWGASRGRQSSCRRRASRGRGGRGERGADPGAQDDDDARGHGRGSRR